MNTYTEMLPHIEGHAYESQFWNAMRGKQGSGEHLAHGAETSTGALTLAPNGQEKYMTAIREEGLFRGLATDLQVYDHSCNIKTVYSDDVAAWIPEGSAISIRNGMADFGDIALANHKLAVLVKLEEAMVSDPFFKLDDYLVRRLAKRFGRAEDNGFINGDGKDMPTGILAATGGADIGVSVTTLTFDNVVKLYFSVKPEYRRNGTWLMNDETALALRTLKDANGNYIWNHTNNAILGKKVCISEFMPGAENGSKPIAFGDFSYYWIVSRHPVCVRPLTEQFATEGYVGYLAYEFLDGKLVCPEAIKVMQMTA